MKTNISLLLAAALCLIVAGCHPDSDASTPHTEARAPEVPAVKTVSGRLSGFDCAVVGELCPTTHRGGDYTSGVFTEDGSFFFVVNVPQSFLTQYFLKTVEVEGTVYAPYDHAIEPEAIHVLDDGNRRLVYEAGYFIDEDNRRATFHDGQFQNGRWIVP